MIRRRTRPSRDRVVSVPTVEDLKPLMIVELQRARRYGRPLALLSVSGDILGIPPSRLTDLVAYAPGYDRYVMLLPETDAGAARQLVARLAPEAASTATIAAFPDDALTLAGLLEAILEA